MALATKHLVRFLILVIQAFSYLILILKLLSIALSPGMLQGLKIWGASYTWGPLPHPFQYAGLAKSEVLRELSQRLHFWVIFLTTYIRAIVCTFTVINEPYC